MWKVDCYNPDWGKECGRCSTCTNLILVLGDIEILHIDYCELDISIYWVVGWILYKYHHSTKLYRKISRVCCRSIVTSAKHE